MKTLWLNPSFLDYRIPVYKGLNELLGNDFYIMFSQRRVKPHIPQKTSEALRNNAICFGGDKVINFGDKIYANKHLDIPITSGLYRQIKAVKPDLVIAEGFFQWTPMAVRYCATHKVPLMIAYERTKWTERCCPAWRTLYRKVVDRFVSGYTVNGSLTKEYLEDVIGVRTEKIFIGGMSADSHGLAEAVANYDIENETDDTIKGIRQNCRGLLYVYSGQMIPRKGVKHLLGAWSKHVSRHQDDRLLLVGGGELLDGFMAECRDEKSITFTGAVDYDNIYKYYAISDVFVIPTLEDNWSLVVPEAMACGLPVACSIYNGCHPELVRKGENGITFDPLKEDSIVEALDLFHHVDLAAYGKRSREIEAMFNSDVVAQNIYDACVEIYNRHRKK